MTAPNPECFHLSASCVAAFKACPMRFRLKYREGLRPAGDTDAQRTGTNWHALHEVYHNYLTDTEHPEIGSEEQKQEDAMQAVVDYLHEAYKERPEHKTAEEWATEKQILAVSFTVYLWYYQDDDIEYLYQELPFRLPLHNPDLGMPLSTKRVVRVGKIDHLIRWNGVVGQLERKSTSRSIEDGGQYWEGTKENTQVSMYATALKDLEASGQLPVELKEDDVIGSTIYDVWKKPGIKPKDLSQGDTVKFLTDGTYFDVEFAVQAQFTLEEPNEGGETEVIVYAGEVDADKLNELFKQGVLDAVFVDEEPVEFTVGKSGKPAIHETAEMYGVRLADDMYNNPEKYFKRKEIARTEQDIVKFRKHLWNVYQSQRLFDQHGTWYQNEMQCRATFHCQYIPICHGEGGESVCDGKTTPSGFTRIFTDVTVDGEPVEDED